MLQEEEQMLVNMKKILEIAEAEGTLSHVSTHQMKKQFVQSLVQQKN